MSDEAPVLKPVEPVEPVEPGEPVETVETRPVLFAIKGDPTPEEVAALVAVLRGVASSAAPAEKPRRSEWSAPHRLVRRPLASGPGGWRSSSLPR